jgi:N-acetylneuraminic acid mutarotase
MPTPRFYLGAAAGSDGGIYAIGGEDNVHILSVVEKYTPSTNTWQSVAPLPIPVTGVSVTAGLDGRIYAIGGLTDQDTVSGAVQVYDPSAPTPAWTSVAPLPVPVFWAAATTGADGRIYVVGGYPTTQGSQPGVNTVQIYDPVSNSWSIAAPISVPRYVLAAATGPDGRVYALPGGSVSGTINVVEAYSASTNAWTTVASLNTARQAEAAVTTSDGRIFAIGGSDPANDLLATVEAYSTGTNTWAYVAFLNVARAALAAAKGLDGKIYALGGRTTSFSPLGTVEVYNPSQINPVLLGFSGTSVNPTAFVAEPVNTATGNYFSSHLDLRVRGKGLAFDFVRNYNSLDNYSGPLG